MSDKKKSKKTQPDEPIDAAEDFGVPRDSFEDDMDDEQGSLLGGSIKKLFAAGLSAAFLTEESVRSYLQDVKLPKEVLKLFLEGAAKSKEQLMNRVGNEVISIIQKIDFVKEASRFVETHKFRVSAEIEVIKKEKTDEGSTSYSLSVDRKGPKES
jgi:hypothetical protein